MIINCMMFLNENDVLEIKINNHWNIVDKFIVVESSQTHTGDHKGYNLDIKRFAKYTEKLMYYKIGSIDEIINYRPELIEMHTPLIKAHIDNRNENIDDWIRDSIHAYTIYPILEEMSAKPDDILLIDCCDEIISTEAISAGLERYKGGTKYNIRQTDIKNFDPVFGFVMNNYYYKLNLQNPNCQLITGSMMTTYSNITKMLFTLVRHSSLSTHDPIHGGYHFGFLDGTDGELALQKFKSWAHSKDKNTNYYGVINTKQQAVDRLFYNFNLQRVPLSYETHPKYLIDNIDKYKHLLY